MYFQVLEKLKEYKNFDYPDIQTYDKILFNIYKKNYHLRFNPRIYLSFGFEVAIEEWVLFLEELCKFEYLKINFELCCPLCDESIEIFGRYIDIPFSEMKLCESCENFVVSEKDIFITYSFKESFRPSKDSNEVFDKKSSSIKKYSFEEMMLNPEVIFERNSLEKKGELKTIFEECISVTESTEKGRTLELLAEILFEVEPFLKLHLSNKRYSTGELDRLFKVKKIPSTIFQEFSDILVVECKNWSSKVGAKEIRDFSGKMEDLQSEIGIIISKEGITGDQNFIKDAKGELRRLWDRNSKIIIVFDADDLNRIIYNQENLYGLLETKYFEIKTL